MNVGIFLASPTLSGGEKRAARIASALDARGHHCSLFLSDKTQGALFSKNWDFKWPPIVRFHVPVWLRWLGRENIS